MLIFDINFNQKGNAFDFSLKFSIIKLAQGMLSTFLSQANDLTRQIIAHFHTLGGFAWRNNTVGIFDRSKGIYRTSAKKGVSDILAILRGKFYAIEVKIGADRLSPEQDGFLQTINHHQGNAFVVSSFEDFLEKLAVDN